MLRKSLDNLLETGDVITITEEGDSDINQSFIYLYSKGIHHVLDEISIKNRFLVEKLPSHKKLFNVSSDFSASVDRSYRYNELLFFLQERYGSIHNASTIGLKISYSRSGQEQKLEITHDLSGNDNFERIEYFYLEEGGVGVKFDNDKTPEVLDRNLLNLSYSKQGVDAYLHSKST